MTKKEILKQIEMENKRLKKLEDDVKGIEFDLKATKKALKFWKNELKKHNKENG